MIQNIIDAINGFFGNGWLTTFFVSMIPLIELKGAIPVGIASDMSVFSSFLMAYLGSTLICVPLFFLLRPILNLLKKIKWLNFAACKVEYLFIHKAEKMAAKGESKNRRFKLSAEGIMMLGVFGFVAIPLPMTGVWTGTAVAVFFGLKFVDAIFPIALGNLVAGVVISILTWLLSDYVNYIIIAFAVVAVALLIFFIVKVVKCKLPADRYPQFFSQNHSENVGK